MRLDTRSVFALLLLVSLTLVGCGGGGGTNPPPPPENHAPSVTISATPPDTILYTESATFTWSGSDPDGNLAYYVVGLNDNFENTTAVTKTYTNLLPLTIYRFKIVAVDSTGLRSDTSYDQFFSNALGPAVVITSGPPTYIHVSVNPTFTWHGVAPNSSITGYYAGLNGNLTWITDTTISYTGLPAQNNVKFQVVAENYEGLTSDTASYTFNVVTYLISLGALGQGVMDADSDGYWTQFNVRWFIPYFTQPNPVEVRLIVGVKPDPNGPETMDSSALVIRSPGETDTLDFILPSFTKGYYKIRAELHDAAGVTQFAIPYDNVPSLTHVGLEHIDGTILFNVNADTANRIDTLAPFNYYESIDLLVEAYAYGDPVDVRLVLFERTSAEQLLGQEHVLPPDLFGHISETGLQGQNGWHIVALSAPDVYDYRIEILDNQFPYPLLAQINYGEPQLTDIPLGINVPGTQKQSNRATPITK